MNWDKFKENASKELCSKINNFSEETSKLYLIQIGYILETRKIPESIYQLRNEVMDKIHEIVMQWDIRNYLKLKELCPKTFTKSKYSIELTENGWELISI